MSFERQRIEISSSSCSIWKTTENMSISNVIFWLLLLILASTTCEPLYGFTKTKAGYKNNYTLSESKTSSQ